MSSKQFSIAEIFDAIEQSLTDYRAEVKSVYDSFSQERDRAKRDAEQFKDEKTRYDAMIATAKKTASAACTAADKRLADKVNGVYAPMLKDALTYYITANPDPAFIQAVKLYQEFDLDLKPDELDGLIEASQGNYMALKVLAAVAEKKGYTMSVPSVDEFEKKVESLQRYANGYTMFIPQNCGALAREIFDSMRPLINRDGHTYMGTQPLDSLYIATSEASFNSTLNGAKEFADAWKGAIVPPLSSFKKQYDSDFNEITPEQQRAEAMKAATKHVTYDRQDQSVEMAHQIGQQRADANEEAARVMEHYEK